MEASPNKLYSYLILAALFILILILALLNIKSGDNPWLSFTNAILTNLVSSSIIIIVLVFLFNKKFFNENLNIPFEEKTTNSEVIKVIQKETLEIDLKLNEALEKIDNFTNKKNHSSWNENLAILSNLRGYWIEYIPKRENISCEFSIGKFYLDDDGKHEFDGMNYNYAGKSIHYKWETKKILAPIRVDKDTINIYYIYARTDNVEYEGKYGMGKLVAKRVENNNEKYDFVEGFFFNEATLSDGVFQMKLHRLSDVAKLLGKNIDNHEESIDKLLDVFKSLKTSRIHLNW